eukprot:2183070-Rhodomonas_salina.1
MDSTPVMGGAQMASAIFGTAASGASSFSFQAFDNCQEAEAVPAEIPGGPLESPGAPGPRSPRSVPG